MNDNEDRVHVHGWLPRAVADLSISLGPGGARNEDGTVYKMVEDLEYVTDENNDDNGGGLNAEHIAAGVAGAALVGGGVLAWTQREKIAKTFNAKVTDPLSARLQQLRDRHPAEEDAPIAPAGQLEAPTRPVDLDAVLGTDARRANGDIR